MPLKRLHIVLLSGLPALAAGGAASAAQQQVPAAFTAVVNCRSIADQDQRLACYDRAVAQLESARARNEVVVVDRDQIRKTRRSLFGLTLPDLSIFGGGDEGDEQASRLETTIARVQETPDGKWVLTLQEGGTWVQIDNRNLIVDPRAGAPIKIRRAALGSYLANVDDQSAIRVRRVR